MSNQIYTVTYITTLVITILYNYIKSNEANTNKTTINELVEKINKIEKTVDVLKQSLEELEEKIDRKNSKLIESNTVLNSKLEDFINYSYDVYDENDM